MASGTVYKITNNVTDKCYIGQTVSSIGRRWSQHVYNANSVARKCRFLENSIRKYGAENFTIVAITPIGITLHPWGQIWCKFDSYNTNDMLHIGHTSHLSIPP